MPNVMECCGTCKFASYDEKDGYMCMNAESEYVADYTEYAHSCDSWKHKERKRKKR